MNSVERAGFVTAVTGKEFTPWAAWQWAPGTR
ncbi:hypothetical protein SROCM77S_03612 [Streptomyces rochei]